MPEWARPTGLRTIEEFIARFRVTRDEVAGWMSEPNFESRVLSCRRHWVKRLPRVIDAIFRNAEDSTRDDQWEWVQRAARIAGMKLMEESSPAPAEKVLDL